MAIARKHARKFRFLPRFTVRAFLIVVVLLAVSIAPLAQRTRVQMRLCERLKDANIEYALAPVPGWLQSLPKSWLNGLDGHWCRTIGQVNFEYEWDYEQDNKKTDAQQRESLRKCFDLLAQVPKSATVRIQVDGVKGNLADLTALFASLTKIQHLDELVFNFKASDLALAALPKLPNLMTLDLGDFNESPIDLRHVHKFPHLQYLRIADDAKDNDLSPLAMLRHLSVVDGLSANATDMQCLTGHPSLEAFKSPEGVLGDAELKILSTCPNLQSIESSHQLVTDQGLAYLSRLKNLKRIELIGSSISDTGFANLGQCTSLESVTCCYCKLTDAIGPTLDRLPNLRWADFDKTLTSAEILKHIHSKVPLDSLCVGDTRIKLDDLLTYVQNKSYSAGAGLNKPQLPPAWYDAVVRFRQSSSYLPTEERVTLAEISGISGRFNMFRNPGSVRSLNLCGTDIIDDDLKEAASLFNLTDIDVSRTNISAQGLAYLTNQVGLRKIVLGPIEGLDDALKAISSIQPLEELELCGERSLPKECVDVLCSMTNLKQLTLTNTEIDGELASRLSQIRYLERLASSNKTWNEDDIEQVRLEDARCKYGIPGGIRARVAAKAMQESVKVVDESEIYEIKMASVLDVSNIPLSPRAIGAIAKISGVRVLDLSNTGITDDQVSQLKPLLVMSSLKLDNNPITNSSIDMLLSMNDLNEIGLANTKIDDEGFKRLLSSKRFYSLDLSHTSVTEHAWDGIDLPESLVSEIILKDVSSLSQIIETVPRHLLPTIGFGQSHFWLGDNDIAVLRGQSNKSLHSVVFNQETMQVRSPAEILAGDPRVTSIQVCKTNNVVEIFKLADRHPIYELIIKDEHLVDLEAIEFPTTLRYIYFENCAIDTHTVDTLCKCAWLRDIRFEKCNLEGCSLESLLKIRMLCGIAFQDMKLSPQQITTLDQLRPTLLGAQGW